MNKQELLLALQTYLSDVIKEDKERWSELDDHEISLDETWHLGFARAIQRVTEIYND